MIGTASEQNHEFLRGLGAEPIVYGDALEARVLALAGGPVDAVADFVGGQLETTLAVLREGGAHASIADESVTEHDGHSIWVRPDGMWNELVERDGRTAPRFCWVRDEE